MSARDELRDALAHFYAEARCGFSGTENRKAAERAEVSERFPAEGERCGWPALQRVLDAIEGQRPSLNEIGAIIADGYDTDYSTQEIAVAVFEYVTRGEPNRFLQEADDLHGEPAAPTPEASR